MTDYLERCFRFEMRDAPTDGGDGLTLEGYAAVFDTPTRIDSWEGTFDEQIAKGAFRKTIKERTPVLQFDHGRHPLVGSLPIGAIDALSEDDNGLFVRARLVDNWLVEPVRDAIANGSVDGMSFRFEVVKDEWRSPDGKLIKPENVLSALWAADPENVPQRTLREVKVPELGPVVFPAYESTSVGVRGANVELARFAALLRDDPDARAEVARLLISGTRAPVGDGEGPSTEGRAATTEEPGDHSEDTPGDADGVAKARARERALRLAGVLK